MKVFLLIFLFLTLSVNVYNQSLFYKSRPLNLTVFIQANNTGAVINDNLYTINYYLMQGFDSFGNISVSKIINIAGEFSDIQTTQDNNLLLGGHYHFYDSTGTTNKQSGIVLKCDSVGNVLWARYIESKSSMYGFAYAVRSLDNNNYVACVQDYDSTISNKKYLGIVVFDSNGNMIRNKAFSLSQYSLLPSKINYDNNNNLYITGLITNEWDASYNYSFCMKLDEFLNLEWAYAIEGNRGFACEINNNSLFMVNHIFQNNLNSILLHKISLSGSSINSYKIDADKNLYNTDIYLQDGLLLSGYYNNSNIFLFKVDSAFNAIFARKYNYHANKLQDYIYGPTISYFNNCYFLSGIFYSNITSSINLIKTDINGLSCNYNDIQCAVQPYSADVISLLLSESTLDVYPITISSNSYNLDLNLLCDTSIFVNNKYVPIDVKRNVYFHNVDRKVIFENFQEGYYNVKLFNISGVQLITEDIFINNDHVMPIGKNVKDGIYIITINNESFKIIICDGF